MKEYEIVIGLEIHAELNTKTKIFCSCKNSFGGEGNTQCCPICAGFPGALPRLNRKVVEYAIRMGHATNCEIEEIIKQDRKNYFYPDLPKGYQISQQEKPLCHDGIVEFSSGGAKRKVRINRIHIEEDAGKLLHREGIPFTLVDLNRCGVPLIEIVTEPDLRSSVEARDFMENIRNILLYIGISDCKMQEGSIRADVNVSVREKGNAELGVRCEMKNVNTFSGAQRAIEYEAARQIAILESGGSIEQETRRWDDEKGVSFLLRNKEEAQDYRFFNEPDIPSVELDRNWIDGLKKEIPELPEQKLERYICTFKLSEKDAWQIVSDYEKALYFDRCIALDEALAPTAANWLLGDVAKLINNKGIEIQDFSVCPERLIALLHLLDQGLISGSAAKSVLSLMMEDPSDPGAIVEREGLIQNSDADELAEIVDAVLENNAQAVADYRNGHKNVVGFLVGQCMKQSKGKGNPQVIQKLLSERLN